MARSFRILFIIFIAHSSLNADIIETFYGPIEVVEPVILDILSSQAFQRLQGVHQYGIEYYTFHTEPYTRYDHCLGVFTVLRKKGLRGCSKINLLSSFKFFSPRGAR